MVVFCGFISLSFFFLSSPPLPSSSLLSPSPLFSSSPLLYFSLRNKIQIPYHGSLGSVHLSPSHFQVHLLPHSVVHTVSQLQLSLYSLDLPNLSKNQCLGTFYSLFLEHCSGWFLHILQFSEVISSQRPSFSKSS